MIWKIIILMVGVYAGSTAVIMIKKCHDVPPVLLSAWRLLLAAVALSPLFFRDLRRHRGGFGRQHLVRTILPALGLGIHFIFWNMGARMTPAANASLIVNMVPVAMPFLLFLMIREKLNRWELAGTGVSMIGMALLGAADFRISEMSFHGDLLCFLSMLFLAYYMALGRKNRDFPSIWLYVVPLYAMGGLVCLAGAAILENPVQSFYKMNGMDLLMILGLVLVPTVIGHSVINLSMRYMRGQVVSISCLSQFVFGGIMGYYWLGEKLDWLFVPISAILVAGAVIALWATPAEDLPLEPDEIGRADSPGRIEEKSVK
ncbi:MAG: DMT family transporter [Planctomycetes bacterium]|nr:DMT family transporter [Planctomycetota bacterium]